MGFPLTQDGELDFDTYFSMASEDRLNALIDHLSQRMTPDAAKDLANIRDRITEKHHEIVLAQKKDKTIPAPTLMQELFAALSEGVKSLQVISDDQKEKIAAQKQQQKQTLSDSEGIEAMEESSAPEPEIPKKKKSHRHRCIIC